MWNFLLDTVGADSRPDLHVGFQIDWSSFFIGVLATLGTIFFIWLIKVAAKTIIDDYKKEQSKKESQKSDE